MSIILYACSPHLDVTCNSKKEVRVVTRRGLRYDWGTDPFESIGTRRSVVVSEISFGDDVG